MKSLADSSGAATETRPFTAEDAERITKLKAREYPDTENTGLRCQLGIESWPPVVLPRIPNVRDAVNVTTGDTIKIFHLKAWGGSWAAAVAHLQGK